MLRIIVHEVDISEKSVAAERRPRPLTKCHQCWLNQWPSLFLGAVLGIIGACSVHLNGLYVFL